MITDQLAHDQPPSFLAFSTKRLVLESLCDIEASILIELQSIANIPPFSKQY